ncbi:DUF4168 domain-containing protein [Zhouia sp. PK063]|uniref:DUF4168 domain-containing protein n=1 Tax=Zhouia sp. PK063 TaxID=3373602 RepID=UPI0037B525DE
MSLRKLITVFTLVLGTSAAFAQQKDSISDQELSKFADTYKTIQVENQKVQQEMIAVIKDNGLKVERFTEIQKQQKDPNIKVDATDKEKKEFTAIVGNLQKKQVAFRKTIETAITANGLTVERYQEIFKALQTDPALQQRLNKKLKG